MQRLARWPRDHVADSAAQQFVPERERVAGGGHDPGAIASSTLGSNVAGVLPSISATSSSRNDEPSTAAVTSRCRACAAAATPGTGFAPPSAAAT
jgi:hypothetical protein